MARPTALTVSGAEQGCAVPSRWSDVAIPPCPPKRPMFTPVRAVVIPGAAPKCSVSRIANQAKIERGSGMDESVVVSSGLTRRGFLGAAAIGATGVAAMGVGGTAAGLPGGSVRTAARRLPPPASITATDPALLSAVEAASLLQSGRLHPRELLDACLARSGALDGQIGGWVRIYPEMAYSAADAAARRLSAKGRSSHGEAPPVCGIPVALKDVFAVAGLPSRPRAGCSRGMSRLEIPLYGPNFENPALC